MPDEVLVHGGLVFCHFGQGVRAIHLCIIGQDGTTPLHDACGRGDSAIVKVLLRVPGVKADLPKRVRPARIVVPRRAGVRCHASSCARRLSWTTRAVQMWCFDGMVQDGTTPLTLAVRGSHDITVKIKMLKVTW